METTAAGAEQLHARLKALAREQRWDAVREVVTSGRLSVEAPPEVLATAARAVFLSGSPTEVRDMLQTVEAPPGELAALRGDARALTGSWEEACRDYARAAKADPGGPVAPWVTWRLSLCEDRERRRKQAALQTAGSRAP
jgi:hypothetical protein